MKKVKLFTDGSCLGNPGPGGWAYILEYQNLFKKESGGSELTTNNKMELLAVINGLKSLKEPCEVELYSDSSYVVNAINDWLEGWIAKSFNKVKNVELWEEYIRASKDHKIIANWVKGHSGHPQNEECDLMARMAAQSI